MNRRERLAMKAGARRKDAWEWEDRSDVAHLSPVQETWGSCTECWVNLIYSVQVYQLETTIGAVIHLATRRHDGERDIPWADAQRIKNELIGEHRLAVEIFPPASEVVDQANMYHLWVFPSGHELPFGLTKSGVSL